MSDHSAAAHADHAHDAHGEHEEFDVHAHVSSVPFYLAIFGVLIFFTVATVGVSYIHLGALNLAVAILIASIKASLVVLFFMHLKYDSKFNGLIFVCSLLFIGVFFAYTQNDTGHRAELDESWGGKVFTQTGQLAPGGFEVKAEAPPKAEEGKAPKGEAPKGEAPKGNANAPAEAPKAPPHN